MSTVKELLNRATKEFDTNNIEDSMLKSRVLIQYVLKRNSAQIIFDMDNDVSKIDEKKYLEYVNQIIQGKPLQYITHLQEFMGLDFYVDENVLIPQPDTEILVENAVDIIKNMQINNKNIDVLDMCTGSGAIAISIAKMCEGTNVYAVDISKEALNIAKKNALKNGVNINFLESDMFETFSINNKKFDVIVSNPPYIEKDVIKTLKKDVQNEPRIALDGGNDGLEFYRILPENSYKHLKNNGKLLIEIGYNQKESVEKIFMQSGRYCKCRCIKDLSGNDRVMKFDI